MKHFWNYLFYFTWQLHNVTYPYWMEKPFDYLFCLSNFLDKYNKRIKKAQKKHMEDPYCGFNIGSSFQCMIITTMLLFSSLEIFIFFSLDTNLSEILNVLFGITIPHKFNAIAFFSSVFVLAYILCEFLLGLHRDCYIQYFKEFKGNSNSSLGYWVAIVFHLSSSILLIILILYFDV